MNLVSVEPVWRPENQQKVFRLLLDAMSYPGRVFDIGNAIDESPAELGIAACLIDDRVTFADPDGRLDPRERGMLRSTCVAPELADYILHDASCPPLPEYAPRLGDIYRPDDSATLVLSGTAVGDGPLALILEGPGIEQQVELRLDGFDSRWFIARERWVSNFPQGVDIFLCDRRRVAALPRTCRLSVAS